jgi:aquaporin TIP
MKFDFTAEGLGFTDADLGERTWLAALAEFIATLLFVFIGCGAVVMVGGAGDNDGLIAIALAHGLAIAALVAATARLSGGHINPAVTFGAVVTGRIKPAVGVLYVAAQLLGAIVGALLLDLVIVNELTDAVNLGAHSLSSNVEGEGSAVVVEIILTFILVFVVFATAIDAKGLGNLAPIAIGLAVLIDHFVGVRLTGASMNPARSFGPALVAGEWDDHWVYWVGPLAGGALAGLVYYYAYLMRQEEAPPAATE